MLIGLVGAEATRAILDVLAQFALVWPHEPHFALSLLATHDDHRGRGLGMNLWSKNLGRIDTLGAAAYLESTNPSTDARYLSAGFEPRGAFTVATGHEVSTMWRPAR